MAAGSVIPLNWNNAIQSGLYGITIVIAADRPSLIT